MPMAPPSNHFLLILCTFAICVLSGQDVEGHDTIFQLLEGNSTAAPFDKDGTDFDIFTSLFTASSRESRLEEHIPGDITVLAPDDNAFRRALGDLGLETTSELETYENFIIYLMHAYRHPIDFLMRIMYYHIVKGELNSTIAPENSSLATWDEPSTITREGNTLIDRSNPDLPNPTFDTTRMNTEASNGVIYVIDYVLFPEVMRKIKLPEKEKECSTPEPTLEEIEYAGNVAPLSDQSDSGPTPNEEPSFQTAEPSQIPSNIPVGLTLPSDASGNISHEPGAQKLTLPELNSPLPFENLSRVEPSPELTSKPEVGVSESSSPEKPSDIDISASAFPLLEISGTVIPLEEEIQGPTLSTGPMFSVGPIPPAEETLPKGFSSLEFPLGQVTPSSIPTSLDDSPAGVVNNEIPTPFPFVGPIPEETSSNSPKNPAAVPEAALDNKHPPQFSFVGPIPEATSSTSSMTSQPSLDLTVYNEGPTVFPLASPASEETEADTPSTIEAEPSFPDKRDDVLSGPSDGMSVFSATPEADVPEGATTAKPDASTLPSP